MKQSVLLLLITNHNKCSFSKRILWSWTTRTPTHFAVSWSNSAIDFPKIFSLKDIFISPKAKNTTLNRTSLWMKRELSLIIMKIWLMRLRDNRITSISTSFLKEVMLASPLLEPQRKDFKSMSLFYSTQTMNLFIFTQKEYYLNVNPKKTSIKRIKMFVFYKKISRKNQAKQTSAYNKNFKTNKSLSYFCWYCYSYFCYSAANIFWSTVERSNTTIKNSQ